MIGISWQITLLALVLLPVFVLPARAMGGRLAGLSRDAAAQACERLTRNRTPCLAISPDAQS